jgi:putative transcriptional regulator
MSVQSRVTPLARIRAERDLTQAQLAELAGVSVATISALETGRTRIPQVRSLSKLARALGVGLDALLGEDVA